MHTTTFIRPAQLAARRSISETTVYRDIARGLLPRPVRISSRAVGFPADEIAALDAALIAGRTDIELRAIVKDLERARAPTVAARIAAPKNSEAKA